MTGSRKVPLPVLSEERVFFDFILLKKRKKSFWGGNCWETTRFLLLLSGIPRGFSNASAAAAARCRRLCSECGGRCCHRGSRAGHRPARPDPDACGGVSVASSDGVTASPGPAPSAGTVLSEPAATAAAGAPAHTRASPASPGSSASSHDPIRDMDFDNVPALRSLERPGSRALRAGAQRRAGGRPAQYLERAPADTSSAEGPHRAGLGLQDERQSGEAVAPLRGIACQGGCGCQGGCFVVRAERH